MSRLKTACVFLIFSISNTSFADEHPFRAVQDLFAGMAGYDYQQIRDVVTPDFQLLEVGEVWDIDNLFWVIQASGEKYKRRNFFYVIRTQVHGDVAWISYWNRADFETENKKDLVTWLESAVVIRSGETWKVQMLHSTRVDPSRVPADVVFEEYSK